MIRSLTRKRRVRRSLSLALTLMFAVAFLPPPPAAVRAAAQEPLIPVVEPGFAYRQTNLVTDSPGLAPVLDPLLVNPWGISMSSTSSFWVANAGSSTSTVYRGDAGGSPLVIDPGLGFIHIPPTPTPTPSDDGGLPTGTVANPVSTEFVVPGACASPPCGANFLFASLTGNITAWDPNAPAAGSTTAVIAASQPGHVYTGLAISNKVSNNFLYAADIRNNNIDVFNSSFVLQPEASFPFTDPTAGAGALPADYHVHNIQELGGELYVTYAKIDPTPPTPNEPYVRPGGAVNVFDFNGVFKRRIHLDGPLSAPWGLALAPASFGIFSNALLVGSFTFGDNNGRINAFNPTTGAFLGALQNEADNPIIIDGLRGLQFGNGGNGGDPNTLYFAAGIGRGQHGLFGKLNPTTQSATSLFHFATDEFVISEGNGHIDITVVRAGHVTDAASVNYATFDAGAFQQASQKSDYQIALGRLDFAPGETSKTFRVLFTTDGFSETTEVIDLVLSNPSGAGAGLGSPTTAQIKVVDPGGPVIGTNPIDQSGPFVRQHYLDFLNREPDAAGLAFWTNEIESCGADAACREAKRVNVSAAFFLSIEFQRTGYLAYLTHRAAFGTNAQGSPVPVLYGNFMRDTQALQRGFVFGQPGSEAVLEANTAAYFNEFVARPEFVSKFPATLTNEQFVDALLGSAGLSPSQVRLFVVQMTNSQEPGTVVPTTTTGEPRPVSSGTARFQFNQAQTAMTFTATISNIDVTGSQTPDTNDNLTAAHIHAGPSVAPGVNGPVVWGFFGLPFNDNNPKDQVFFPTAGVGGVFSGKWDAPEGQNTTLAAQLDNLRSGHAYINFHTRQFPGGEIRGNFPAADAFRNQLIQRMNDGASRAAILRAVVEAEEMQTREFNAAFVAMQYFGYLRRDPDPEGFQFWLDKLNAFNGNFQNAEMVKAFINSAEYRQRFGPS